MNKYLFKILFIGGLFVSGLYARELPPDYVNHIGKGRQGTSQKSKDGLRVASNCLPATSSVNLDINNVRAMIHNGGDMWWDLASNPRYEVPKVDNPADARHSLFAGSVWIGGKDKTGQLRIAAQTYRQSGNDFYPGPLRNDQTASTEKSICEKWDKHFVITAREIDQFIADYNAGSINFGKYPTIKDWPAINSDPGFEKYLAPFVDVDGDGDYNPNAGDYPKIIGDQAIWWVINDKGNIHSESQGQPIGIEMQCMAFSFATTNEINNMTFYKYKLINRSTLTLTNTYLGVWVDADVGYFLNDFVGCDTTRGLGYCYNGTDEASQASGYPYPTAVGVDFFLGPLADTSDGIDNDRDGLVDEVTIDGKDNDGDGLIDEPDEIYEHWAMSNFFYYNNDFSQRGNPENAIHFYGYLAGFWKDGAAIVNDYPSGNGNGYPDAGETYTPTHFMFPGDPANCRGGGGWTEPNAGNSPGDRRFVISAGPFTLLPGAVNEVVEGVVWYQDPTTNNQAKAVCGLLKVDDIAQALFDANFQLLEGPDAPNLYAESLDRELLLSWSYEGLEAVSNNAYENYSQADPVLVAKGVSDPVFEFEGYILYQLKDNTVSAADLDNTERARVVAQCDIRNGVATIVNRTVKTLPGLPEPIIEDQIMVQGENKGLFHSVRVTEDLFADGDDKRLVNYRKYYYAIVAYAYNDTAADGRKFIRGNGNFKVIAVAPHPTDFEFGGLQLASAYGDGPQITSGAGSGNGTYQIELAKGMEESILQNNQINKITYKKSYGPIDVKVVNPKELRPNSYKVVLLNNQFIKQEVVEKDTLRYFSDWALLMKNGGNWDTIYKSIYVMKKLEGGSSYNYIAKRPLDGTEQIISGHGISVSVHNPPAPGSVAANNSYYNDGFIDARVEYADSTKEWFSVVPDIDGKLVPLNWIQAGKEEHLPWKPYANNEALETPNGNDTLYNMLDFNEVYENVLGGGAAPYCLATPFNPTHYALAPGVWKGAGNIKSVAYADMLGIDDIPNVELVITPDPTKWSKCIVMETSPIPSNGSGSWIFTAKWRPARDVVNGNKVDYRPGVTKDNLTRQTQGWGIFPGYAIDLNTGRRLNILFGEATWYAGANGDDMLWNPTDLFSDFLAAGGRHYIYITNTTYDGCQYYAPYLLDSTAQPQNPLQPEIEVILGSQTIKLHDVFKTFAWVIVPQVAKRFQFKNYDEIPTEARISLRVMKQYDFTTGNPEFEFNVADLAPVKNDKEIAKKSFLEDVRIVPNPFYTRSGFSRGVYEGASQLDARCKIINLPQRCVVRIYTLNGVLVRTFNKNSDDPDIEWDLKNGEGVPVASGIYLVNIDAGELGQRTLKFLMVAPEVDLSTF